ncbi:response regulator [Acidaminobacter sp. JC074]|uniref:response regulator n=1 Tax=Acidaminobacter sp. JC074 TaxID=2530199 RepID=UPI001F1094AC|nr:response regulator [Acidaminobacter sp. JC074]MCH4890413.1 response regulator [Acidaminobacter sp. JC074]
MKRVLIVDDAMFMRSTLKMMLRKGDYDVVGEAQNGVEAIQAYKKLNPDIVTLDIHMPEMGGVDALEGIMKFDPHATVVMISAAGDQKHVLDAMKIGAKNFIVKPFSEDKVFQVLNKL